MVSSLFPPPLPPLVAQLVSRHGLKALAGAEDAPWLEDGTPWVVFLPGHGRNVSETGDVAVILPELLKAIPRPLNGAVAGAAAEQAILARTGVLAFPALVFLRGNAVLGSIPRVRDWNDYLERFAIILEGRFVPEPIPSYQ